MLLRGCQIPTIECDKVMAMSDLATVPIGNQFQQALDCPQMFLTIHNNKNSTMRLRIPSIRKRLARKSFLGILSASSCFMTAAGLCLFTNLSNSYGDGLPRVAQLDEPPAATKSIVRTVRQLIEQGHILHPQFNDEMSTHGFDMFIRNVDPLKTYFLESDLEEFKVYETKLDDLFVKNNINFAYLVYKDI